MVYPKPRAMTENERRQDRDDVLLQLAKHLATLEERPARERLRRLIFLGSITESESRLVWRLLRRQVGQELRQWS